LKGLKGIEGIEKEEEKRNEHMNNNKNTMQNINPPLIFHQSIFNLPPISLENNKPNYK
jgi:hypothetical protein